MPHIEDRDPDTGESTGMDMDAWQKREHEVVFAALSRALDKVSFPASKSKIAREVGDATLTLPHEKRENEALSEAQAERQVSDLPLVKYVQALPDRRYETAGDVRATLDARWQDLLSYRDANWEAAANQRDATGAAEERTEEERE